jgi:hypothetical protein
MDPVHDPDPRETEIVAVLAAARERDRAPASLRARIERERTASRASRRARPLGRPLAYAGALAAVLVIIALAVNLLPSGTPGAPTISQAVALAVRGPAMPAPAVIHRGLGTRLTAGVDLLYFPDWRRTLGWRAVGVRTDPVAGRHAVTVYYARGREQVAYTIVATPPLAQPAGQSIRTGSLTVRALRIGGRAVVTWRREGDTCVLSSSGLGTDTLAALASWSDQPGTD